MSDRLPSRPEERRIVVVMSPSKYEQFETGDRPDYASDGDVGFVSSMLDSGSGELARNLERRGLLKPNNVLVQNPYDLNSYVDLDGAEDELALRKALLVARIAQILGAKKVSVTSARDDSTGEQIDVGASGGYVQATGKADVRRTKLEKLAAKVKVDDSFDGGECDIESARNLLAQAGLDDDASLSSLVEARAHSTNILGRRQVTIDMSRESARTIEFAADIRAGLIKANSKAKRHSTQKSHFSMVFTLEF